MIESPEVIESLMSEWYSGDIDTERRESIALMVQESLRDRGATCFDCHQPVFFLDYGHAVIAGHIYSYAGLKEYGITQLCEFCFDEITVSDE